MKRLLITLFLSTGLASMNLAADGGLPLNIMEPLGVIPLFTGSPIYSDLVDIAFGDGLSLVTGLTEDNFAGDATQQLIAPLLGEITGPAMQMPATINEFELPGL
jgi:hypothetical protein